ncbi:hypothetical protein ACLVWU_13095 [Bdellovibrio sp. HCB290]|uniref:hypothetical protein n=1 Tax=Bdellovibrio sp. HCB290 TaxID=3394356 RepID=UPI0039B52EF0
MKNLLSVFASTLLLATGAQAATTVQGTWGADQINWQISTSENSQQWNLHSGSVSKQLQIQNTSKATQITAADGLTALNIDHSATQTSLNGQLDGRKVELAIEHTNNGTLWFKGVFKNHRPSLRFDVPTEHRKDGRATGFFKNELADLYMIRTSNGYWFKGYMNGYWIDLNVKRSGNTYTFEGAYLSKQVSLVATTDGAIDDVIEYLLLDTPIPNSDFLNLGSMEETKE